MTHSATDSPGCADTTNGDHFYEPCSCCRALAQVRMPIAHDYDSHSGSGAGSASGSGSGSGKNGSNGRSSKRGGAGAPIIFQMPGLSLGRKNPKNNGSGEKPVGQGAQADDDENEDGQTAAKDGPASSAKHDEKNGKLGDPDEWHDDLGLPKKRKLWQGLDGVAVMLFGVAIPAFMIVASCLSAPKRITLLLLNHPVEILVELLLVFSIPAVICFCWSSLCKNKFGYSLWRGAMLGGAIGSAIFSAVVCVAALFWGSGDLEAAIGTNFTTGFCWLAFLSLAAAVVGGYLVNRIRLSRDFQASRLQIITYTLIGAVLSLVAFGVAEARPWTLRLAELKAVATQPAERDAGLKQLRALNPERELRMECSDSRAAGLAGLFIPIKPTSQLALYFAVTGKPYSLREFNNKDISFMADDDLRRRIVGEAVPGLSLIRSSLDGAVHPETLSSTVNWTFVFKNSSTSPQEARTELGLPPGAVVTGLTLWSHGDVQDATVAAAGKADGFNDVNWKQVNLDSPAIISDLGHGRMFLHCYPVQQEEELKVNVTMVVPLKPDGERAATLDLPTFISTNFDLSSNDHSLRLHSPTALTCSAKNLVRGTMTGGEVTLSGKLSEKQLQNSNFPIFAARTQVNKPVVVFDNTAVMLARQDEKRLEEKRKAAERAARMDEHQVIVMIDGSRGVSNQLDDVTHAFAAKEALKHKAKPRIKSLLPRYVVENVQRVAAPAPRHLVVVVDGSASVKQYAGDLSAALTKLPAGIPTQVIIASQEDENLLKPVSLVKGMEELKTAEFAGGQNNLRAVVNAAALAGESDGGAVLWVHGPQPSVNEEIYIMSQYVAAPSFYELRVGTGDTDTFDFFKNHSDIGPFSQVPRNSANLSDDLRTFFSKWQPNSNDYAVGYSQTTVRPDDCLMASAQEGSELLALNASRQCAESLSNRHIRRAARIAVAYGVVSPVSCALINTAAKEVDEGEDSAAINTNDENTPAVARAGGSQSLKGATNGTIAPQGADATYVTGVNTAGTVRVNNLANLEALLNIIANLAEIGCALLGAAITLHGLSRREPVLVDMIGREFELSAGNRMAIGIVLILAGLAVPGLINWFVASARDANLFN